MSGRGYHVSRDPSCYGCGDPAQWTGHWCDQCKAPVKFPWDMPAAPLNQRQQHLRDAVMAEPTPMWLAEPF